MHTLHGKEGESPRAACVASVSRYLAFERDRVDLSTEGRTASRFPSAKRCSSGVMAFTRDRDGVLDHICIKGLKKRRTKDEIHPRKRG